MIRTIIILTLLSLMLVSCRCEVSSRSTESTVGHGKLPKGDIQILKVWSTEDDPNKFQTIKAYEICLDGVVYYWEYMRDQWFVKYDKDTGGVKFCGNDLLNEKRFQN